MARESSIQRYRYWYAKLLRLYPQSFHRRFGPGMEQTFIDLLRDYDNREIGLFSFTAWIFIETTVGIFKENTRVINMRPINIVRPAIVALVILLLPLLAMQFGDEVAWDLADFVIAGLMLFSAGLMLEFVASRVGNIAYKAAVAIAVAAGFLLVWMNLAVGLIGNENNPANLIYFGVLAVGFVGAIIARLQPDGMARTLFATALTQALATIIAVVLDTRVGVLFLNVFFLILFIGSASLFRYANLQNIEAELQA